MQRLENKFAEVKSANRAALITYIMAYAPGHDLSTALLSRLPSAGADIIELGLPFSDPMADGPVIQLASQQALAAGAKLVNILTMVTNFRKQDNSTPIILMGYYNPIVNYGLTKFCAEAAAAGADGLLIVDLPIEEDAELRRAANANNLAWIRLVTPTTDAPRIAQIASNASGFIYYVSVSGVTGTKSASTTSIATALTEIKKHTNLPVAVGFGIKSAEDVKAVAAYADAVVVGSAIVKKLADSRDLEATLSFVKELTAGL